MKPKILIPILAAALLCGCTSTQRRTSAIAGAGAAGAGLGYAVGDKKPLAIAAGAVGGAGLTALALGRDSQVEQEGFDQGYIQGQADAIKRQYWLRQALERSKANGEGEGERVYYVVPGPQETADGKKLEPHNVVVPVVE